MCVRYSIQIVYQQRIFGIAHDGCLINSDEIIAAMDFYRQIHLRKSMYNMVDTVHSANGHGINLNHILHMYIRDFRISAIDKANGRPTLASNDEDFIVNQGVNQKLPFNSIAYETIIMISWIYEIKEKLRKTY